MRPGAAWACADSAARQAEKREPLEPEEIGDRDDILRLLRQTLQLRFQLLPMRLILFQLGRYLLQRSAFTQGI